MNEEHYFPYYTNMPSWGSQNVRRYGSSEEPQSQFPSWGSENIGAYGDSGTVGDWSQTRQPMNFANAGNALAGGAAGAAQPQGGYMPNQFASIQGAVQGYAAGGAYGALAGAITGPVSQVIQSHKNLNNLDTNVGSAQYDAYGRPVYQGGEIASALNKIPELQKTENWDSTNLLGLGRKARNKRIALVSGVQRSQQSYNQAENNYRNQNLAMQDYYDRINHTNYRNLFSY